MNISDSSKTVFFLTAWLASLVVASVCARSWPAERDDARCDHGVQDAREEKDREVVNLEVQERARSLLALNRRLRHESDRLRRELEKRQEVPAEAEGLDSRPEDHDSLIYDAYLDRLLAGATAGDSGDSTLETIGLIAALARSGDKGITYLRGLTTSEDPQERCFALWSLSFLPGADSLDTIVNHPWADESESEGGADQSELPTWPWELVKRHIYELPAKTLEPYMEEFEDRLEHLETPMRGTELEVCAQLALRHGQERSRELLDLAWKELTVGGKNELINSLYYTDTEVTMDFLEQVEGADQHAEVRENASRALGALSGS